MILRKTRTCLRERDGWNASDTEESFFILSLITVPLLPLGESAGLLSCCHPPVPIINSQLSAASFSFPSARF